MRRAVPTLAKIPFFASLSAKQVKTLDGACVWQTIEPKEWIIDYQDDGIDVFFVTSGLVRILIYAASGKEVILADLTTGHFFGELAAIDGKPRSAGVLALSRTLMARMPGAVFMDTVTRNPPLAREALKLLAGRMRSLDTRVLEQATLNVRQRIYAELLRLSRPPSPGVTHATISPPPTHADLAARVSTHREAVTREFNTLERQGLLERRRGALVLTDPARLLGMLSHK